MSSFDLERFAKQKNHITRLLTSLARLGREFGTANLESEVGILSRDLSAENFRLVVVGEFSRGKSTFINALLGQKLLPSSVEPTTTVLTEIVHGEEVRCWLRYRDDKTPYAISQADFTTLVAPAEPSRKDVNERHAYEERLIHLRRISSVELTTPSPVCRAGVKVLDTPGTNDLDPLREQITYDIIPRSDAVIFVLSARQALTQSEKDFLVERVMKADISKIFFLLNHADRLTDGELQQVLSDTQIRLREIAPGARVYPISARITLRQRDQNHPEDIWAERFSSFEADLAQFLTHDKAQAKLNKPRMHGLRLCRELRDGPFAIAKSSIGVDLPELELRAMEAKKQLHSAGEIRMATIRRLQVRLESRRLDIVASLRRDLYAVSDASAKALNSFDGPIDGEALQRHLESEIAPIQTQAQAKLNDLVNDAFQKELAETTMELSNDAVQIQAIIGKIFTGGVVIDRPEMPPAMSEGDRFALKAGAAGLGFLFLPFVGPVAILAGWLGGKALGAICGNNREQLVGEIRILLDRRYRDTIPATVENFSRSWEDASRGIITRLNAEFDGRLKDLGRAHEISVQQFQSSRRSVEEEKSRFQRIESELFALTESFRINSE